MNKPGQGSSQSKRAVAAREWRDNNREKRRFNTLLNGFIGVKYAAIYSEYTEFYNMMKRSHPEAGNLTKTKAYKRWKKDQESPRELVEAVPHACSEGANDLPKELDEAVPHACSEGANDLPKELDEAVPHDSPVLPAANEDFTHDPTEPDMLSRLVNDSLQVDNVINPDEVDNIIDSIINELVQDDAVRNILGDDEVVRPSYEDKDEGIGLNVVTELEDIIEPFDFQLEVEEGFDF